MRTILSGVLLIFVAALGSANGPQKPFPPGLRDGDKAVQNGQDQIEPPREKLTKSFDAVAVKAEAVELQTLASAVPDTVDQVTKGMIPKDAAQNLKKIEKLAKHLRSEIAP
jgi:hypothetical protein